jgi:hypothetical protein
VKEDIGIRQPDPHGPGYGKTIDKIQRNIDVIYVTFSVQWNCISPKLEVGVYLDRCLRIIVTERACARSWQLRRKLNHVSSNTFMYDDAPKQETHLFFLVLLWLS